MTGIQSSLSHSRRLNRKDSTREPLTAQTNES